MVGGASEAAAEVVGVVGGVAVGVGDEVDLAEVVVGVGGRVGEGVGDGLDAPRVVVGVGQPRRVIAVGRLVRLRVSAVAVVVMSRAFFVVVRSAS